MSLTFPEIRSTMDPIIGLLNTNFENHGYALKKLLINIVSAINRDPNIKTNLTLTSNITNVNPPALSHRALNNIVVLGGSAFDILSDYLSGLYNIPELKLYAPRTNDFDIAICVDDVQDVKCQESLIRIAISKINDFDITNMTELLDFDDSVEIPGREEVIGLYKNNKIQITKITNRNYFTVRVNINMPGKGATHVFELVLWNNKDKEECKFEKTLLINEAGSFDGVVLPSIPDLIENTSRVIFRRGQQNTAKCRQDYMRLKWLFNECVINLHNQFNESILCNDPESRKIFEEFFGDSVFIDRINAQIIKIDEILPHCGTVSTDTDYLNSLSTQYREYLGTQMHKQEINRLFNDKLIPFDNQDSYYPGDDLYNPSNIEPETVPMDIDMEQSEPNSIPMDLNKKYKSWIYM